MMRNEIVSIREIGEAYRRGKVSPVEVVEEYLRRMEAENVRLNAYITVAGEEAKRSARESEKRWRKKQGRGPLDGVPLAIKDNIYTKGMRTTAGSKILENFVPERDAEVVVRLRAAGAVILGKTNLHEFAYGVTTENPHYGPVRNPWDVMRTAGGSSGGSAAALAAGLCAGSVGTDTGGSVRIPAGLCGVVGLKPTFGAVSVAGTVPLAVSLDHVGPMGRCVEDVAILFGVMVGKPVTVREARGRKPLAGVKIGWPKEYFFERVEEEVKRAVEAAVREMEKLGAKRREVSVPRVRDVEVASTALAFAEATRAHMDAGWWPGRAGEYGADVRERLGRGEKITAVEYLRAYELRAVVRADFARVFAEVDVMVAPTTPMAATKLGDAAVKIEGVEETVRSALIRLNRPANLTGMPAISVPCGRTREGLPVGMQLMAGDAGEGMLFRVGAAYEQAVKARG